MTHVQAKSKLAARKYGQQQIRSPKPAKPAAPPRVPHVAKLMALAIRLEHLIETGQIADQAEIARTAGITRARLTQILNLNRLAPDIQQAILNLEPTANPNPNLREGLVRKIATEPNWSKQRKAWKRISQR